MISTIGRKYFALGSRWHAIHVYCAFGNFDSYKRIRSLVILHDKFVMLAWKAAARRRYFLGSRRNTFKAANTAGSSAVASCQWQSQLHFGTRLWKTGRYMSIAHLPCWSLGTNCWRCTLVQLLCQLLMFHLYLYMKLVISLLQNSAIKAIVNHNNKWCLNFFPFSWDKKSCGWYKMGEGFSHINLGKIREYENTRNM